MKTNYINLIAFAAGAAVGSAVTYMLIVDKYKKIAQEEIDSVKETFANRKPLQYDHDGEAIGEVYRVDVDEKGAVVSATIKPSISDAYAKIIKNEGYTDYSNIGKFEESDKKGDEIEMKDRPRVISPEEFDENPDYEKRSLTYYADKVLTDEDDEPIEDVDTLVGLDSLTTFGKYEEDSVFVRDDILKTDYEILLDLRRYQDVIDDTWDD